MRVKLQNSIADTPGSEVMERYLQQDLDEYFFKILSMLLFSEV